MRKLIVTALNFEVSIDRAHVVLGVDVRAMVEEEAGDGLGLDAVQRGEAQ